MRKASHLVLSTRATTVFAAGILLAAIITGCNQEKPPQLAEPPPDVAAPHAPPSAPAASTLKPTTAPLVTVPPLTPAPDPIVTTAPSVPTTAPAVEAAKAVTLPTTAPEPTGTSVAPVTLSANVPATAPTTEAAAPPIAEPTTKPSVTHTAPGGSSQVFTGTLHGGIAGIGGEATGWILALDGSTDGVDVDVTAISAEVKKLDGRHVSISGQLKEKNWVERGKTRLLVADQIAEAPLSDLNK